MFYRIQLSWVSGVALAALSKPSTPNNLAVLRCSACSRHQGSLIQASRGQGAARKQVQSNAMTRATWAGIWQHMNAGGERGDTLLLRLPLYPVCYVRLYGVGQQRAAQPHEHVAIHTQNTY